MSQKELLNHRNKNSNLTRSVNRKNLKTQINKLFIKALRESYKVSPGITRDLKKWLENSNEEDREFLEKMAHDILIETERRVRAVKDLLESDVFYRRKGNG